MTSKCEVRVFTDTAAYRAPVRRMNILLHAAIHGDAATDVVIVAHRDTFPQWAGNTKDAIFRRVSLITPEAFILEMRSHKMRPALYLIDELYPSVLQRIHTLLMHSEVEHSFIGGNTVYKIIKGKNHAAV